MTKKYEYSNIMCWFLHKKNNDLKRNAGFLYNELVTVNIRKNSKNCLGTLL